MTSQSNPLAIGFISFIGKRFGLGLDCSIDVIYLDTTVMFSMRLMLKRSATSRKEEWKMRLNLYFFSKQNKNCDYRLYKPVTNSACLFDHADTSAIPLKEDAISFKSLWNNWHENVYYDGVLIV